MIHPGRYTTTPVLLGSRFTDAVYAKLTSLPMGWHARRHSGETIQRVSKAAGALFGFWEGGALSVAAVGLGALAHGRATWRGFSRAEMAAAVARTGHDLKKERGIHLEYRYVPRGLYSKVFRIPFSDSSTASPASAPGP